MKVLWCCSYLVWLLLGGSIPTCTCFHLKTFYTITTIRSCDPKLEDTLKYVCKDVCGNYLNSLDSLDPVESLDLTKHTKCWGNTYTGTNFDKWTKSTVTTLAVSVMTVMSVVSVESDTVHAWSGPN